MQQSILEIKPIKIFPVKHLVKVLITISPFIAIIAGNF